MTDETKKEPTTAYMFATVRRELESRAREACGIAGYGERAQRSVEDLAQLERRMGAMERAIVRVAPRLDAAGFHGLAGEIRAALTDVPPVFTLEEVRKAMEDVGLLNERDRLAVEAVLESLAALRSTGGGR